MERKGKKSKARDKRPARARYWELGTPRRKKVRNIMRNCANARAASDRLGYAAALRLWESQRKGRMRK